MLVNDRQDLDGPPVQGELRHRFIETAVLPLQILEPLHLGDLKKSVI